MAKTTKPWKTILAWGLVFVAIYMVGAFIDGSGISGTCMFILVPYFTALAVTLPVITVNRFGTGMGVYVPYMLLGFPPLFFFDWLQSRSLVGLWAVFVLTGSGLIIGAGLDLANRLTARLHERTRAITIGATMQLLTFFVMLVGLTYLYQPDPSPTSHLRFFDQKWLFSLPWMLLNGAFGGYTAYALKKRV